MKDRQLAKRIEHQFAKYDTMGRLTCTICNGLTVKSEALWPSHLTSKPHRLNYQNHQNHLNSRAETNGSSITTLAKRKTDEMSQDDPVDGPTFQEKKVRFDGPSSREDTRESSNTQPPESSLPADFFDDPSQAPTKVGIQAEEEEDLEWKAFEAALQEEAGTKNSPANLFAQASVIAEPVLYESEKPSETRISQDPELEDSEMIEGEQEQEEDPIEKKIREEKEEIMDRIQNEEREQLEADQRVLRMKARVNAFRASRKRTPRNLTT